ARRVSRLLKSTGRGLSGGRAGGAPNVPARPRVTGTADRTEISRRAYLADARRQQPQPPRRHERTHRALLPSPPPALPGVGWGADALPRHGPSDVSPERGGPGLDGPRLRAGAQRRAPPLHRPP